MKTPIEKMQAVLDAIYRKAGSENTSITIPEIQKSLQWQNRNEVGNKVYLDDSGIDIIELNEILDLIEMDGYIRKEIATTLNAPNTKAPHYTTTFKGRKFVFKDGYVGENESLDAEKLFFEKATKSSILNAQRLNFLTAILAIGTSCLAVSECVKIYFEYRHVFFLYITIVLTLSAIAILTLIYKQQSNKRQKDYQT
jgi:hypothetical protein